MAFTILSPAEQVAGHLQSELLRGRWRGEMPGVLLLESELAVNRTTIQGALRLLEEKGLLVPQGTGRRRRIELPQDGAAPSLQITILPFAPGDMRQDYVLDLRHRLEEAGHATGFADRSLLELNMDVQRVARMVGRTETDAWVVMGGSRELLDWFADRSAPAFALHGRGRNAPLASIGSDKVAAFREVARRLTTLGHRRIVLLEHSERRKPEPGYLERCFLEELEANGVRTGAYNLPDWQDHPEGLHRCLDSLFRLTPPTALVIDTPLQFFTAERHLARMGLLAPRDVSLVCADDHLFFEWYRPSVARIRTDSEPWLRRIVRWAGNVARGRKDLRKTLAKAEFIDGDTIGPAPERK
jgi:DNA-binding LacI/PurR family transcriptional regulator